MNKKRSYIWNFFEEIKNNKVKCNFCSQILAKSSSTFNLIRHTEKKHPGVKDNRVEQAQSTGELNQGHDIESDVVVIDSEESIESSESQSILKRPVARNLGATNCGKCNSVENYFTKKLSVSQSKLLDIQLTKMIVKEYHPFSLVEDCEFKIFIEMLNRSYKMPCRKTISSSLIPHMYEPCKEKVKEHLCKAASICVTTDCWTDQNQRSFMSATAHFINNGMLSTFLLDCVHVTTHHTSENLCTELKNIFIEWEIDNKILIIVTDNAANIVKAVSLGEWRHLSCLAHNLNLIVQNSLSNLKPLLITIKSIVQHFRSSSKASTKLIEQQKQMNKPELKIIQDVITRWNSTYLMLNRLLEVRDPLVSTIALLNVTPCLTSDDWKIIRKSCEILKLFDDITKDFSSEKEVSVSKIIVVINAAKKFFENFDTSDCPDEIKNMLKDILEGMDSRFNYMETNFFIREATLLDPRFKKAAFENHFQYERAYESISRKASQTQTVLDLPEEHLVELPPLNSKSLLYKDFDKKVLQTKSSLTISKAPGIIELDRFLQEPQLSRTDDPLVWWEKNKSIYPRLYKIMLRRLCIMPTSVPSETIFSKTGQILTEKRSRLSAQNVRSIIFLKVNWK